MSNLMKNKNIYRSDEIYIFFWGVESKSGGGGGGEVVVVVG